MASEAIVRVSGVHKYFRRGSEQIDVLDTLFLVPGSGADQRAG